MTHIHLQVHCEAYSQRHCSLLPLLRSYSIEMSVGAEAICPSIRQIASLHCISLAMTVALNRILRFARNDGVNQTYNTFQLTFCKPNIKW